jgi:predicted O-methyltransferase YrrM
VKDGVGVVVSLDDPEPLAYGLLEAFRLAEDTNTAERCRAVAQPYDWETGIVPQLETIYSGRGRDPIAEELAPRHAAVDAVLTNPPIVHPMTPEATEATGVWSTERECYRFIAEQVGPGTRTIETGCGVSTVLLAALGAEHRCVTPGPREVEAIRSDCRQRGVDLSKVVFDIASSSDALPKLDKDEVYDLFLIDGSHGFPLPIVDWFFGAEHLRKGGLLVVDDVPLPAVRALLQLLEHDPRWVRLRSTPKWAAFERQSEGSLSEDWFMQPFYGQSQRARAERWLRSKLRPVKHKLRDLVQR